MSRSTVLHIEADDSPTTRVVELGGVSVRIGRGPQCEVILSETAIAEVQCLLRRRGDTWHIQPVGPRGRVFIEGQPVDIQCPLSPGVPVRVGHHWLTLRSVEETSCEAGTFESPIVVETVAETTSVEVVEPPKQGASGWRPRAELPPAYEGLDEERDRLMRWESRLAQREQWVKASQEERRWAGRGQAAGATLRGRAAPEVTRPSAPPRPPEPPLATQLVLPSIVQVENRPRSWQSPPQGRRPVAPAITPFVAPPVPEPVGLPTLEPIVEPRSKLASPLAPVDPAPSPRSRPAAVRQPEARAKSTEPGARPNPAPAPARSPHDRASPPPPSVAPTVGVATPPATQPEIRTKSPGTGGRPREVDTARSAARTERAKSPVEPGEPSRAPEPPSARPPRSETTPAPLALSRPPEGPEWPTAASIFAACPPRSMRQPAPRTKDKRAVAQAVPTLGVEPDEWRAPFGLAWAASVAVVLIVGLGGLWLGFLWAHDDYTAGLVANRVMRSAAGLKQSTNRPQPLDPDNEPVASWWRSTANHLSNWALAVERAGTDPDRDERANFFLQAARSNSPVHAGARYALAHRSRGDGQAAMLFESLGLSRDLVSLAWTARCLLEAGKSEAALRAYGAALAMAARADLTELDPPAFSADDQAPRCLLPCEDLMSPIVRDLAEHRDWTFAQWSSVLPGFAVAPLAASRVFREKGRAVESEKALELTLARAQEPAPAGCSAAVHLAAGAEALALKGRWKEAEARYRQAIDLMPHTDIRRSWWLNLADVYLHLNDDAKAQIALEAAKGSDPNEEITRRAVRSQTKSGLGTDSLRRSQLAPSSQASPRLSPVPNNHGSLPSAPTARPSRPGADR